jgi:hypothetical protein
VSDTGEPDAAIALGPKGPRAQIQAVEGGGENQQALPSDHRLIVDRDRDIVPTVQTIASA